MIIDGCDLSALYRNPGTKTPGSSPASEDDYWPEFTIPGLGYKELNVTMATGRALKSNEAHFWNSYVVQLQTMLGKYPHSNAETCFSSGVKNSFESLRSQNYCS